MKTKFLLIIFLFCSFFSFGQIDLIPKEYQDDYLAKVDKQRILKDSFDYVLDPIELVPVPKAYDAAGTANFGHEFAKISLAMPKFAPKKNVYFFIIDTGAKTDHEYLQGFVLNDLGIDFTNDPSPYDLNGHATHVAGIIGARANGIPLGLTGSYAGKNFFAILYKALNKDGAGTNTDVTEAILKAADEGKKLIAGGNIVFINMSLGSSAVSPSIENAMAEAAKVGIIIYAASGNNNGPVSHPGSSKFAHAIAASNSNGTRASFSNYGPQVFASFLGVSVTSTFIDKTNPSNKKLLADLSGTSMATPGFAAIAGLVASQYGITSDVVLSGHLAKFATDMAPAGYDNYTGYGIGVLPPYFDNPVTIIPPPPPPPPTDTIQFPENTITLAAGSYETVWRTVSSGTLKKATFSLVLSYKQKKSNEAARNDLSTYVTKFFTNRGFVLGDKHGLNDLGYYVAHFLQMLGKKDGFDITVESVVINDSAALPPFVVPGTKGQKPTLVSNRFLRPLTEAYGVITNVRRR